jgi:hypothetical protein
MDTKMDTKPAWEFRLPPGLHLVSILVSIFRSTSLQAHYSTEPSPRNPCATGPILGRFEAYRPGATKFLRCCSSRLPFASS